MCFLYMWPCECVVRCGTLDFELAGNLENLCWSSVFSTCAWCVADAQKPVLGVRDS